MSLAMGICDKIIVLDQGRKLAEGTPREIQNNEQVMAAYLGQG
jgi:branched-chain amino acid transport system ATP-binding protein